MRQVQTPYEKILQGIAFGVVLGGILCLCLENAVFAEDIPDAPPQLVQQTTIPTRIVPTATPIRVVPVSAMPTRVMPTRVASVVTPSEMPLRAPRRIGFRVASKPLAVQNVTFNAKPSDLPPMADLPSVTTNPIAAEPVAIEVNTTDPVAKDDELPEMSMPEAEKFPEMQPPAPAIASGVSTENSAMGEGAFLPEISDDTCFERVADENPQDLMNLAGESDGLQGKNPSGEQNHPVEQNKSDGQNMQDTSGEGTAQIPYHTMEMLSEKRLEETATRAGDSGPDQDIATLLHALQNSSVPLRFGSGDSETIAGTTTIEHLAQIAEAQNPTMEQASRMLDRVRGNRLQVGLYPNPVVGYTAGELGDEGSAGKQGGFVQQRIVTAGKLGLNRQVAGSEVSQAFYVVEQQRLRVQNDVRAQAMEVLAMQQQIALDQKLLEISQDGLKAAEQLFKSQEVSRADMLQARVEKNSAQLQLDTVRAQYLGAWRKLAAMIGDPELPPTKITDSLQVDFQPLQWDSVLAKLLEESPELAEAKAGVQRAQNNLARQKVEPIPDLEVMGGVLYNDANGDTIGTAQLGASVPLFNRNQGNIASAQAEIASARANVRRVELALQNRLAGAFREYEAARQQCDRYSTEILPDAQETLRITMLGYHQGEFTYLQLLTAQRSCFQATRSYIESLQNLRTNAIRIEGLMLSGGLEF
ncbi:MAG: TolC family protein [Thermoguttaceae bacterium]|nr:TolC family protein [Thermoguttaceae bacterium]